MDIQEALEALGELTGEVTTDDILDRIFGSFCVGK
jgi:tRNA modification GTPase